MVHPYFDLETRLKNKIKIDKNGCWVWLGAKFKKQYGNYAQIRISYGKYKSKIRKAHFISYEHFVGKVPKGKELDHLCHNTLCINPKHLEPVLHSENMKRRKDSGLLFCKYGHKYIPKTIYIDPKGRRQCKICRKNSVIKFYKKVKKI